MSVLRLHVIILMCMVANIEVKGHSGNRVKNLIYYSVDASKGFHPCFRRANGTHQFGCQAEQGGNIGVIHLISERNQEKEMNWVTNLGSHHPYMGKPLLNNI